MTDQELILLTGATGYVGGRLLRVLQSQDKPVRCLARRPENLQSKAGATTEIVQGDVLNKESLHAALSGVSAAFYMVHSMGNDDDFEQLDRQAAENFGQAAQEAGVKRIIYLGGLGDAGQDLSAHLRSRQEVGRVLAASGVPVIELRASIVIGSGSLSFEMMRALAERLPIMITPRWVSVKAQPIAINDLLAFLTASLHIAVSGHTIVEIGGSDVVSYGELLKEYATQRGLRRFMISVPVLTPYLSSLWLGLVTPLYARVGRKLIDSIRHPTIVTDNSAEMFGIQAKGIREAISEALHHEDLDFAETRWSDSLSSSGPTQNWGGVRFGSRLVDVRETKVAVDADTAFEPIRRIGGQTGWYYANFLWHIRGFIDLLVGGVGLRRGRRHPEQVSVGDAIDFWRVEDYQPGKRLRLNAEMKLPGRAWLEFDVESDNAGSIIKQTAVFDPVGLAGILYWYAIYPLHGLIFAGMIRNIANAAVSGEPEKLSDLGVRS